jgi:tRNA (guanosine-2'-O-)-methyltransferase
MPTENRIAGVSRVLNRRQPDLRVVLEGVAIAHNASAVMRTCDAAGVLHLELISPNPALLAWNEAISTRADRWLEITTHASTAACLAALKKAGLGIVATRLSDRARPYTELDYTRPLALVFGSESLGISEEALAFADEVIQIPMVGMVRSLNLSVAVAVVLYEAFKQRAAKGLFDGRRLSEADFDRLYKKWLRLDEEPGGK